MVRNVSMMVACALGLAATAVGAEELMPTPCLLNMKRLCGEEMDYFAGSLEVMEVPDLMESTERMSKCFEHHAKELDVHCSGNQVQPFSQAALSASMAIESDPCDDLVNQLCGSQIKKLESLLIQGASPQDIVRGCSDLISCLIKNDDKIRGVCHDEAREAYFMEIAENSPYAKNIQSCVTSSAAACSVEYTTVMAEMGRRKNDEDPHSRSHFVGRVRSWLNYLQCVADKTHSEIKGEACLKNLLVVSVRAAMESAHGSCGKDKQEEPASVRAMKGELVERQFYREMQHPELFHPKFLGAWMLLPLVGGLALFLTGCFCGRCCVRPRLHFGRRRCCRKKDSDQSVAIGEEVPSSQSDYKEFKTDQVQVVKLV